MSMKRRLELEDEDDIYVGKRGKTWIHERQPDYEDLERMEQEAAMEEEEEDIVLRSRRRQHRLETQEELEWDDGPPGVPMKETVMLPWSGQGRLLWPSRRDEAVVQVEDSQVDVESDDSHTLSGCSSFVVADESESVVEEETVSEKRLARNALKEVRLSLREKIGRLKRRLERVEGELVELESGGFDGSEESGAEVVDERTCTTRFDLERVTCYPWEDEEGKKGYI